MMSFKDFDEKWFVFGGTRFMPQTTIDRKKSYYFKKSGIKEITMHEFRHSDVSLLINEYIKTSKEKNMKIDTAKFFLMMSNRMGHSLGVMQKTYMHLFPTIQDEIVDLLDNL
jgi:integrase